MILDDLYNRVAIVRWQHRNGEVTKAKDGLDLRAKKKISDLSLKDDNVSR